MEASFNETCNRLFYSGLLVAMVTDRDGVIILKSNKKRSRDFDARFLNIFFYWSRCLGKSKR
jgi:hypothetical protein